DSSLARADKIHQMARVLRVQLAFNARQRLLQLQSRSIKNPISRLQCVDLPSLKSRSPQPHQVQALGRDVEVRIQEKRRYIAVDPRIATDHGQLPDFRKLV